jgi:hypothetical protein
LLLRFGIAAWRPTDSARCRAYINRSAGYTKQSHPPPTKINKPDEEIFMNAARIAGIALIVIGLAGFFTGGFSFTKDKTAAKIGPLELTVQEKESVNIPQWLSLGAVALGAIVLVAGFRKS